MESRSVAIRAKLWVPSGGEVQDSSGEISAPSQVNLLGIVSPARLELVRCRDELAILGRGSLGVCVIARKRAVATAMTTRAPIRKNARDRLTDHSSSLSPCFGAMWSEPQGRSTCCKRWIDYRIVRYQVMYTPLRIHWGLTICCIMKSATSSREIRLPLGGRASPSMR